MKYDKIPITCSLVALSVAMIAAPASAVGVPAGTVIENTASASYEFGGISDTVDSNTVEILVDELLDVATATQDGGAVTVTDTAVLKFTVTNTGNGPEAFLLTADPVVAGNDFNVTIDNIAVDTNGNGVYDDGIDEILTGAKITAILDPDVPYTVFVLVTAPAGAKDGDLSSVNLMAEAVTGIGTPGDVFAGKGEGGGDAVVGATGADDDALGPLKASNATVTLVKSAKVSNSYGTSEAIPGATITYQIVANVTGSGSVTNLRVTDTIPTGTQYDAGTMMLNSAPLTDADDTDAGKASAAGIGVLIATAASGTPYTITFDVTID